MEMRANCAMRSMAGMRGVEFIDAESVESITPRATGTELVLKPMEGWNRLQVKMGEATMTSNEDAGNAYANEVSVTFRGLGGEWERMVEQMKQKRWVLRLTDNNGVQWVVGNKEVPMRFGFNIINDGSATGRSAYEMRWHNTSRRPAERCVPADIDAEGENIEAGPKDAERFMIIDGNLVYLG